jgi:adenosylmethionine-8-amino-7-oxononanoate aminotransferase
MQNNDDLKMNIQREIQKISYQMRSRFSNIRIIQLGKSLANIAIFNFKKKRYFDSMEYKLTK